MAALPDPRIHAYRQDVAAEALRGRVQAARFVPGSRRQVLSGIAPLRAAPRADAEQVSELLHGEILVVYDQTEIEGTAWCWGQAERDGYVGYLPTAATSHDVWQPTHRVTTPRAHLRPEPNVKAPPLDTLCMNAPLAVIGTHDGYAELARGGWVAASCVGTPEAVAEDYVGTACRLLETPYLWGGRTALGVDCSGLVQTALASAGLAVPRDTDQQAAAIGIALAASDLASVRRGDIIYWRGHCALVVDQDTLIHANAHDMRVALAGLAATVERYRRDLALLVSVIRRPRG
ncbi:MAG: NlpC/P60 family protein [Alphaproteobacteria bacterium]|nr:NlpC/P60 family protein [Alphaproteobacteria bacterium]